MSTPVILYRTQAPTSLQAEAMQRRRYPLPPQSQSVQFAAYGMDLEYCQQSDQFPPAPKNTIATSSPFSLADTKPILTGYSQPQYIGGGMSKFSAAFQVVPATWNDMVDQPYTFPGFPGLLGQTGSRDIFTDSVNVRIQNDYYVLDPGNVLGGNPTAGGGVANASALTDSGGTLVKTVFGLTDIPLIAKTFFVVAFGGTPDVYDRTNSLIQSGGQTVGNQTWFQTLPQKANYQGWMANAVSNGWTSTVWDGATDSISTYGQLVSDDSKVTGWVGNIVHRKTLFVLAK